MKLILNWILGALGIVLAAYILPGVHVESFLTALVVALVLGFINIFIKPFALFLTLPINILTVGLFTLVINTLMIMLAAALVPGFSIEDFGWAFIFSILLWFINLFFKTHKDND